MLITSKLHSYTTHDHSWVIQSMVPFGFFFWLGAYCQLCCCSRQLNRTPMRRKSLMRDNKLVITLRYRASLMIFAELKTLYYCAVITADAEATNLAEIFSPLSNSPFLNLSNKFINNILIYLKLRLCLHLNKGELNRVLK